MNTKQTAEMDQKKDNIDKKKNGIKNKNDEKKKIHSNTRQNNVQNLMTPEKKTITFSIVNRCRIESSCLSGGNYIMA